MARVEINAGICGFTSVVNAQAVENDDLDGESLVKVQVETTCPHYAPMNDHPFELDPFQAVFVKVGEGAVYDELRPMCVHAACPVPSGVTKAIEVAAGLALPKDVSMTITA